MARHRELHGVEAAKYILQHVGRDLNVYIAQHHMSRDDKQVELYLARTLDEAWALLEARHGGWVRRTCRDCRSAEYCVNELRVSASAIESDSKLEFVPYELDYALGFISKGATVVTL